MADSIGSTPSPPPSASLLPTAPSDPLYAPYRDEAHPQHEAAVAAVHARFQDAHGGPQPWAEDALERPGPTDHQAPYTLLSPQPQAPPEAWPPDTAAAVANAFDAIAGGRKELAQQALDWLEDGPADRLPEPPPSYQPPTERQTIATLQQGWGDRYAENLRLAQAVVRSYDAKKGGELREYLERTGLGNDPAIIRLAARTGRQWLKQGWRP